MASAEDYAKWIVANQDKRGTPEFETVAKAYQQAKIESPVSGQIKARNDRKNTPVPKPSVYEQTAQEQGVVENLLAGVGGAMKAPYMGIKQMVGQTEPGEVEDFRRAQAGLNSTAAGTTGNVLGAVATVAPSALIPGANTVIGGAAIGGAYGAAMPVGEGESRIDNIWHSALSGGLVPAVLRTAKIGRAAVWDPATEAGRNRIGGKLLVRSAADPEAVIEKLRNAKGATPGFSPTVGQAADDEGIAALERTMRAIDPRGFDEINKSQKGALADALRNLAGTPEARAQQEALVEKTAKELYGKALKEQLPVTPELVKLASRPSMRMAEARAKKLAAEQSGPFNASLDDLRPQSIAMEPTPAPPASVLKTDSTRQYMGVGAEEAQIPNTDAQLTRYFEVPPVESVPVRDMHTLKMGMDALLKDPTLGIAGREAGAISATRNRLLDLLPESYQKARLSHIELNKPINQMDIGKEFYNRFVPALADDGKIPFKSRADAYAEALRNGDEVAKNVVGLKNAKLESIMTPEQMGVLRGVESDSRLVKAAEAAGRGVGSDTVQKLAMSNLAAETGVPNWISNLSSIPGGWMKTVGDVAYKSKDEQIRAQLAELLRDPQAAAAAMKAAGVAPSKIAEVLRMGAQTTATALPAVVNTK